MKKAEASTCRGLLAMYVASAAVFVECPLDHVDFPPGDHREARNVEQSACGRAGVFLSLKTGVFGDVFEHHVYFSQTVTKAPLQPRYREVSAGMACVRFGWSPQALLHSIAQKAYCLGSSSTSIVMKCPFNSRGNTPPPKVLSL